MTSMEWETLDVIGKNENRIHYYLLAQELGISAGYAYIICRGLKRSGYGDFDTFRGICSLTEKGKDAIEKSWLLKLKKHKENIQKQRVENKKRISKNVEIINY